MTDSWSERMGCDFVLPCSLTSLDFQERDWDTSRIPSLYFLSRLVSLSCHTLDTWHCNLPVLRRLVVDTMPCRLVPTLPPSLVYLTIKTRYAEAENGESHFVQQRTVMDALVRFFYLEELEIPWPLDIQCALERLPLLRSLTCASLPELCVSDPATLGFTVGFFEAHKCPPTRTTQQKKTLLTSLCVFAISKLSR